jgi:hypothetical protein
MMTQSVSRKRWLGAATLLLVLAGAALWWGRGSSVVSPRQQVAGNVTITIDSWDTWTDTPPGLPPAWVAQVEELFGRRPRRADMVQVEPAPDGARRVMVRVFLAEGNFEPGGMGLRLVTDDPAQPYRSARPLGRFADGRYASMQGIFDLYGPYKVLRLEVNPGTGWVSFAVNE